MSHDFFSCHEPLPPDTRCGELRGGLSSRVPTQHRSLDLQFSPGQNIYVSASTSSEGRKKNFCPAAVFRPQVWQS